MLAHNVCPEIYLWNLILSAPSSFLQGSKCIALLLLCVPSVWIYCKWISHCWDVISASAFLNYKLSLCLWLVGITILIKMSIRNRYVGEVLAAINKYIMSAWGYRGAWIVTNQCKHMSWMHDTLVYWTHFDRLSCSPSTQICIYQLLCNVSETYVHLLLNCKIRCVLIVW